MNAPSPRKKVENSSRQSAGICDTVTATETSESVMEWIFDDINIGPAIEEANPADFTPCPDMFQMDETE